jgi:hypothetical protein
METNNIPGYWFCFNLYHEQQRKRDRGWAEAALTVSCSSPHTLQLLVLISATVMAFASLLGGVCTANPTVQREILSFLAWFCSGLSPLSCVSVWKESKREREGGRRKRRERDVYSRGSCLDLKGFCQEATGIPLSAWLHSYHIGTDCYLSLAGPKQFLYFMRPCPPFLFSMLQRFKVCSYVYVQKIYILTPVRT